MAGIFPCCFCFTEQNTYENYLIQFIGLGPQYIDLCISFSGSYESLSEISSDKYLGVILDNRLSFNNHVDQIVSKATKLLNLCRRNLHMCSPELKEIAYKALVRPHLEYASPAWSPHTQRNIDKIESVQTRAARFVLGNYTYGPGSSIRNDIHHKLGWKPLHVRRALHDLSFFF